MADNKVNVYLLTIVAVVSIVALVTIYTAMNTGSIALPEEAIAGQAFTMPGIDPDPVFDTTGTTAPPSCTDTDGGSMFAIAGTVTPATGTPRTDQCGTRSPDVLTEFTCAADGSGVGDSQACGSINPSFICITGPDGGYCGIGCTDTDGGDVRTVAGTVTAADGTTRTDQCGTRNPEVLTEYSCVADGRFIGEADACGNVDSRFTCIEGPDGAYCGIDTTPASCTDTDGGEDFATGGMATSLNAAGEEVARRIDNCAPAGNLIEFACAPDNSIYRRYSDCECISAPGGAYCTPADTGTSPSPGASITSEPTLSLTGSGPTPDTSPTLLPPATGWRASPAAMNPTIIKFFFKGSIDNVKVHRP